MIKCFNCGDNAEKFGTPILIGPDGDFVCCKKCMDEYEKERDVFFNEIIHDDKKFNEWINGN
jgi:trimethylamine:corrinoid methyltransferase-like protein